MMKNPEKSSSFEHFIIVQFKNTQTNMLLFSIQQKFQSALQTTRQHKQDFKCSARAGPAKKDGQERS